MTILKIGCVLAILLLTPFFVFQMDFADAAAPTLDAKFPNSVKKISGSSGAVTSFTINNVVVSSDPNRLLLVGVTLGNFNARADTSVVSVTCGSQTLESVPGSISGATDQVRNEFFALTNPDPGTCNVVVTVSQPIGFVIPPVAIEPATGSALVFSGVDTTNGITSAITLPTPSATKNSTAGPLSSLAVTNQNSNQLIVDLISGNSVPSVNNTVSVVGANQNSTHQTQIALLGGNYRMGLSVQLGNSTLLDPMTWDMRGNGLFSTTALLINSCGASCTVSLTFSTSSCTGDCTPPTLGIDKNNHRVVSDGFAFNENFSDVELYYTPYPLITAYVGEENSISLKIYENSGPQNLAHVGIAFGLGEGESFNESNAVINWDRSFDGTEKISLTDPENVLENIRVEVEETDCNLIGSRCTDVTVYHTFRSPLEFNMVATNIWDHDRNAWQNYFNHGMQISGDSLNPPKIYDGIYKGKIFSLNETGKNASVDKDGFTWTYDKGIWNRDYIPAKKIDPELTNPDKIWAINHVTNNTIYDISDIVILERNLNYFVLQKDYQILLAESILEEMCPKCLDDPFEEIDDIFYYELPVSSERLTTSLNQTISFESERATESLAKMFSLFYPGKVDD